MISEWRRVRYADDGNAIFIQGQFIDCEDTSMGMYTGLRARVKIKPE